MTCPNCGNEVENGMLFCGNCGQSMSTAEESAIAQEPVPVEEEASAEKAPQPADEAVAEKTPKKKMTKKTKIIIGVAAGVVVVAAAVLAFLIYIGFGAYTGPLGEVKRGLYNVIDEGNFTINIDIETDYISQSGELLVDFDDDSGELKVYGEIEGDRFAIRDEMIYNLSSYSASDYDMEVSASELIDGIQLIKDVIRNKEADWESVLDDFDLTGDIEDYIDIDELPALADTAHEFLNDEEWLEKYFGFSENGDEYTLEFTLYDALKATEDIVKDHIDDDDFEDYCDYIDRRKRYTKDVEVSLVLTVDGGELVGVDLTLDDDADVVKINASITDIGDTEVDGAIDSFLSDFDDAGCSQCGASYFGYDGMCYDCYWQANYSYDYYW